MIRYIHLVLISFNQNIIKRSIIFIFSVVLPSLIAKSSEFVLIAAFVFFIMDLIRVFTATISSIKRSPELMLENGETIKLLLLKKKDIVVNRLGHKALVKTFQINGFKEDEWDVILQFDVINKEVSEIDFWNGRFLAEDEGYESKNV